MDIYLILVIILGFIIFLISISFYGYKTEKEDELQKLSDLNIDFSSQLDKSIKKIEELKIEKIKYQADLLKFKLQPHTINNLLSNLKLISNKLNKSIEILTENLNYILYGDNNNYSTIEEEIKFTTNYLKLNDIFLNQIDAIDLKTDIDSDSIYFNSYCIPHLITAYFIENAFKHGDKYQSNFLKVYIKLEKSNFELYVINKVKLSSNNNLKGIGLKNMEERLDIFLNGKYELEVSEKNNEFHSRLIINF